jgi:succinate dehydrogenase / fumarate reductase, cytochrome b subunit
LVCLFYALGVGLLCLHLSHGIVSMFQSLGWKNHTWGPLINQAAKIIAIGLFIGYLSIPAAVLCGYGQDYVKASQPAAKEVVK